MSRHLLLLPAPEAEWALLPPEEQETGRRSHALSPLDLAAGGHRRRAPGPLTPSAQALSMRPDGSGGVLVTEGPFTESVEQMVGFYLVETADRADLVRISGEFAGRGELIEFRDMVGDDDHDHGGGGQTS